VRRFVQLLYPRAKIGDQGLQARRLRLYGCLDFLDLAEAGILLLIQAPL
jgi:hypothetical protein